MKKAKIIILAGQSNAVGVGHTKYLSKSFSKAEIARFYDGYEKFQIIYESHDKISNGFEKTRVNCTEVSKDTLGPEVGIAKKLSEKYPDEEFYIVKCAFGGTSLVNDWRSPSNGAPYCEEQTVTGASILSNTAPRFPGWCYNIFVKLLRKSIKMLENDGLSPEIIAFCWMQGEGDAEASVYTEPYIERYDLLLKDIRKAFEPYFAADCKFIDAGVSERWKEYEKMNANKKAYAEEKGYCFIDTVAFGLTTQNEPEEAPDVAHYDCYDTVKLGELFGEFI